MYIMVHSGSVTTFTSPPPIPHLPPPPSIHLTFLHLLLALLANPFFNTPPSLYHLSPWLFLLTFLLSLSNSSLLLLTPSSPSFLSAPISHFPSLLTSTFFPYLPSPISPRFLTSALPLLRNKGNQLYMEWYYDYAGIHYGMWSLWVWVRYS